MPQILVVGSVPGGDAKLLGPGHSSDIIELKCASYEVSTVCVIAVRQLQHMTSPVFSGRDGCFAITVADRTRRLK